MPVTKVSSGAQNPSPHTALWRELAAELRSPKSFGQPTISEEEFSRTGLIGVTVFWDKFEPVVDVERPDVVLRAYAEVDAERSRRIAFALGYTTDEAVTAGLLKYTVKAATPSVEQRQACWTALRELGATAGRLPPTIRCDSLAEAYRYRDELIRRVQGSGQVWQIDGPDVPDDT